MCLIPDSFGKSEIYKDWVSPVALTKDNIVRLYITVNNVSRMKARNRLKQAAPKFGH